MIQKVKQLHTITIDRITIGTKLSYNLNTNHIGIGNMFSYQKEYHKNNKEKLNKYYKEHRDPNTAIRGSEEHRIRMSCSKQGINREDFNGFSKKVNYKRDHVSPENKCIKLNSRFKGSEMHHLMNSVVIYIPYKIHRNISHNMKTGKNMKEINDLAINYLLNK